MTTGLENLKSDRTDFALAGFCHPWFVHPCGEEHNFIPQFRLITEPSYLGQQIKIVRLPSRLPALSFLATIRCPAVAR